MNQLVQKRQLLFKKIMQFVICYIIPIFFELCIKRSTNNLDSKEIIYIEKKRKGNINFQKLVFLITTTI